MQYASQNRIASQIGHIAKSIGNLNIVWQITYHWVISKKTLNLPVGPSKSKSFASNRAFSSRTMLYKYISLPYEYEMRIHKV